MDKKFSILALVGLVSFFVIDYQKMREERLWRMAAGESTYQKRKIKR